MLFAKLKLIAVGVVSVALVTTGVGVVAQAPGPVTHPDQDRLKAVEEKLDKLLEVLTRQFNPVPPTATVGVLPPATPPSITISRAPDVLLSPPPAVPTPAPFATHGESVGQPVDQANFAHGPGQSTATLRGVNDAHGGVGNFAHGPGHSTASTSTSTSGTASPSLDGRVTSLEQRLSELERRFNELDRRLLDRNYRSDLVPVPAGATSSSRPGSTARSSSSPFEMDPSNEDLSPDTVRQAPQREGRSRSKARAARPPSADIRPRDPDDSDTASPVRDDDAPPSPASVDSAPPRAPGAD